MSVGAFSVASFEGATALGYNVAATNLQTTAVGAFAQTPGYGASAIGFSAYASGDFSFAAAYAAFTTGERAISVGYQANASALDAMAYGFNSASAFAASAAFGAGAITTAINQIMLGTAAETVYFPGAFKMPTGAGLGKILTSDGTGIGTWQAAGAAFPGFGAPGYPVDVAAVEADGVAATVPRADHVHAHGSGYLPNAHHNQAHSIIGADHTAFPGGTTTFLRADATFAVPAGGGGSTDEPLVSSWIGL